MGLLQAFVRIVVAVVVVVTGLLAAAAMAVVAAIFFLLRRPRPSAKRAPEEPSRTRPGPAGDVIDVTATEVPTAPKTAA